MEGASGSSRGPSSPGGVARGGGGSWSSQRNHLAEHGWSPAVAQSVAGAARSVLVVGREGGAGLWATGSRLSPQGRRVAGEAGEYGFRGTAPQDCREPEGEAARQQLAHPPRSARRSAERTAPREWGASRRREESEAGQSGKQERPRSRRPRDRSLKQPGSWGARAAQRAAGDSSLNPENNFELVGVEVGDVDLSYFRLWLTGS